MKSKLNNKHKKSRSQSSLISLSVPPRGIDELVVTCFGAGQEVGRSCILVEISGKRILLDCGVNIATTNRERRLPELPSGEINVDLVLISHIHSDHLCSVPYLTEVRKCKAPIFMSKASKKLAPIMLEDFLKVTEAAEFDKNSIKACLQKVRGVEFNRRKELIPGVFVTAYPAGHLLGATAFYVSSNGKSFLYTGDFSGAADHHLPGHQIPRLFPDILITESTYGNKTREPMYKREKSFVQMVHLCVLQGGKVLIPVFAVGRLQEILLMLNDYWERMNCNIPIYFASGMGSKATNIYKECVMWMNSTVQTAYFDQGKKYLNFSRVLEFKKNNVDISGPCVMVATSGMLNNGHSYNFFLKKKWYDDPKNLVVFPGYCSPHTLGNLVLERGEDNHVVYTDSEEKVHDFYVKCQTARISFSAHADQFEIVTMCKRLSPKNAICIHGDPDSVTTLAEKLKKEQSINTFAPKNCSPVTIPQAHMEIVRINRACLGNEGINSFSGSFVKSNDPSKAHQINPISVSLGQSKKIIHIKKRFRTNIPFEDIINLSKEMCLFDENENVSTAGPIKTRFFTFEPIEHGIMLCYDYKNHSYVNKFCCMIASE